MIKFIAVWVLTVSYVDVNTGYHTSYGATHSYQLQYRTQAECLAHAKSHQRKVVKKGKWGSDDTYANPHNRVRCDIQYVPVGVPK